MGVGVGMGRGMREGGVLLGLGLRPRIVGMLCGVVWCAVSGRGLRRCRGVEMWEV